MKKRRIALISTGGTIEKTYDELRGVLHNRMNNLDVLLSGLTLNGIDVVRVPLLSKDSMDLTDEEIDLIVRTAGSMAQTVDGVVVVHGTDRLAVTGERMVASLGIPAVPVVMTGAMRPYELRNTDAIQNVTEALLAVQLVAPGIYVAMHNRVLQLPGVKKDRRRGTFVTDDEWS